MLSMVGSLFSTEANNKFPVYVSQEISKISPWQVFSRGHVSLELKNSSFVVTRPTQLSMFRLKIFY